MNTLIAWRNHCHPSAIPILWRLRSQARSTISCVYSSFSLQKPQTRNFQLYRAGVLHLGATEKFGEFGRRYLLRQSSHGTNPSPPIMCTGGQNMKRDLHTSPDKSASEQLSVSDVVERAADLLPHQAILENFVHHNPLRHLESMPFRESLEHVRQLESYMSPGEQVYSLTNVDPRKRVNEALTHLCAAFLDRGAAKWAPRFRDRGFLYFFASLENLGVASWRSHAREVAHGILHFMHKSRADRIDPHTKFAEAIVRDHLMHFGKPADDWERTLRSMMLELRGWAGMFHRMETSPAEAPPNVSVRLLDFVAVQSILLRSSMEAVALSQGWEPEETPFGVWLSKAPEIRGPHDEPPPHASAIAYVDQMPERREALEDQFERALLAAIIKRVTVTEARAAAEPDAAPISAAGTSTEKRPFMQLYTRIDDRECSFRRHAEESAPRGEVETFGVAGFFGIPIEYRPSDGRDVTVLAPVGQKPLAILIEGEDKAHKDELKRYTQRRRWFARVALAWENMSFSPFGSLALSALLPVTMGRLWLMSYWPDVKQRLRERVLSTALPKPRTDFELPIPPDTAATLLARTFRDVGTQDRFAPIVVVLGHGAVSVNNPFAAAYNCGACSGREGGPNARLLARLANNAAVREHLKQDHNIQIPEDTVFIGGMHNTTNDKVELYDLERLPIENMSAPVAKAIQILDHARSFNAFERCRRFLLAQHVHDPGEALKHVGMRSTDAAEVRPELNHATNAAVVIGRRSLTRGRFLDRRVFLPSYDPYADDEIGTNLEHVMGPALVVCSGINLEYLFSTIDAEHHGAGSKAPLNVVSNIGVMQGTSGDLRPGLPTQMTEMHTPVRALFLTDAPVARVEAVLARRNDLRQLVHNEWVRFIVRDPDSGQFFRQERGLFVPMDTSDIERDAIDLATPFKPHYAHGVHVTLNEANNYWVATAGMVASCVGPVLMYGPYSLSPYGPLVALCGTALALPVLAFSRRYLHGEFMFGRFSMLSVGLLLGFNIVATAPTLEAIVAGWSLFGFSSTFLIGSYNDRPTVRNNATFAFAAYRISDFALLTSAAFLAAGGMEPSPVVAGGLLLAALFKSSQFPLTSLFVRSMEGPTPASALGYAGLSAHVGVVLLASTMPLWFDYDWARIALGGIGAYTALVGTVASKIRADRKGALARATSATLGIIYVTLACGMPEVALMSSLGHAAFRMIQVLRSPNIIADSQYLRSGLGRMPWPKPIPDWLYRMAWAFKRMDADLHLLGTLHSIIGRLRLPLNKKLSKWQQWGVTTAGVVVAGAPFTPVGHYLDDVLLALLPAHPAAAAAIMAGHFGLSVVVIRTLFANVLRPHRFRRDFHLQESKATPPSNNNVPKST